MNDKNIIRIVGGDKKLLGTIDRHSKAIENDLKKFTGTVTAIQKYDEKNGAERRRRQAAAKAALEKAHKDKA